MINYFRRISLMFLPSLLFSQTLPEMPSKMVNLPEVRPLPGQLDAVPVFNSNSPELVLTEGILLSAFPPGGKRSPAAHLNFPFEGRFDIFAHHISRIEPPETRTLYLGILLHNPGLEAATVDILQAASYLSLPDAPFIELPPHIENTLGTVYAGPGDRVTNDILRGKRQTNIPAKLVIAPGESQMLLNVPIPARSLIPPINGRSTLMRLRTNGRIYLASLALFAKTNDDGSERKPNLTEWQQLLETGNLALPRDKAPTNPDKITGAILYGRVAGVSQGSQWEAQLTDNKNTAYLSIPQPGKSFSYGISTLKAGTLGTNQIQSANLLVRYPDTAYQAHGNYGVQYSLSLPLYNDTKATKTVTIALETPIKEDRLTAGRLQFLESPSPQIFFRGTVRVQYNDDSGIPQTKYVHLVQRRGERGEPLVALKMAEEERRLVRVDFLYPPDATPPQVLTVGTKDATVE